MDQVQESSQTNVESKLDQLAQEASEVTSEKGFMQPGSTRKRGGRREGAGRKKQGEGASPGLGHGSPASGGVSGQPPQVDPIAELMPLTTGLAAFYSNMLVQIAEDQRAALTKEKSDIIAHTSAVCLNQYLPGVLGKHAPAIVLGVTVLETSLTAMRLRNENLAKLREEAKRQGVNPSMNGAGGRPRPVPDEGFPI